MQKKFKFNLENIIISLFFFSFIFLLNLNHAYAWLEEFTYRRAINITNSGSTALTDYQVNITLNTQTLISAGKMRSDCGDIRFALANNTLLSYWIERGCNTTSTRIWVRVPSIPASSSTTIYVYYGNPSATSLSNGTAVFEFFDDFNNRTTLGSWVVRTGTWQVAGGTLNETAGATGTYNKIYTPVSLTTNFMIEVDINIYAKVGSYPQGYISWYANVSGSGGIAGYDVELERRRIVPISGTADESANPCGLAFDYNKWYHLTVSKIGNYMNVSITTPTGQFCMLYTNRVESGTPSKLGLASYEGRTAFDNFRVRKYVFPEPTANVGTEERVNQPPQITIYLPQNTTYFYSNNFVFNFTVRDDRSLTFIVRAFLDNNLIYDNTSYQNNTIVVLRQNLTIPKFYNFTVWANDTDTSFSRTSTLSVIFTIRDFEIQQIIYNVNVYETTQQTFSEVIRYNPDLVRNITSTLVYNQTEYLQTYQAISGNVITNSITISIPQTNLRANNTFYISNQISYYNLTTAIVNTSTYYQMVFTTRADWLQPFGIRRAITILSNQSYINALVPIFIDTQNLINNFKLNSSCQDIRITDIDGVTLLPIRIVNCNTTNTTIWFNSTYIPNNLAISYYIYYANPNATSVATTLSGYNVSLSYILGYEEIRAIRIFQYDEQNRNIFLFEPQLNVFNPETCVVIGNNPFFFVNPNQTCFFYQSQPYNSSYTTSDIYVGQLTNYVVSNYAILSAYSSPITFLLKNTQKDCNKYALRLERLYDVYKYVKDSFFDFNCIATAYLQPYQIYRLYVIDMDTNTVVYQTSAFKIVQNSFTIDLSIQPSVQIVSSNYLNNYNQLISYGCGLNSNTITCYANNLNTLPINVSFKVERKLLVGYYTLCEDNQKASSLTFNCPLDNNTKEAFVSLVWKVEDYNTTKVLYSDYIQNQISTSPDYSGIVVATIFFLGMTALGIFNPFVSIILGIAALIVSVKLGLIYLSFSSIIGLVLVLIIVKIKEENV